MSEWILTKNNPLPHAGDCVLVLYYRRKRGWQYGIGYRLEHASGKVFWVINGTSGIDEPPPKYWQSLPAMPRRRRVNKPGSLNE